MKKLLLYLLALTAVASTTWAQAPKKNIVGIRVGMDMSKMATTTWLYGTQVSDVRTSFHIGVTDQILLLHKRPLYLEVGLMLHNKGSKPSGEVYKLMYLEVPLVLNYHIRVGHEIHIIPFAGLYYGLGLRGIYHAEISKGCLDEDVKLFGEMRELKRSDFGARLGIGISWHNIYLGAAYEGGFLNLKKNQSIWGEKVRNRAWTLSIGYNF